MTGNQVLGAPEYLRAAVFGDVTLVVDYRNGKVIALAGQTARQWVQAASGTDRPDPIQRELASRGLLTEGNRTSKPIAGKPWKLSFGSEEFDAGNPAVAAEPFSLAARVRATAALVLTVIVRDVGSKAHAMSRLLALMEVANNVSRRPAGPESARAAVQCVRAVAFWMPTRVACLEESVAAMVYLAFAGRTPTWCHGVATDPHTLHAWIECDGRAVAEPASTSRYTILRTIPATDRGDE
ncbi:lasso peptide biosynthesis B2 protein [Myceligenerans crystallogenes]|uniref:Microcin J25-processing protein McjB C-terminal domain-containing protein n=1 Tax=Myceligenerans crystallogenes TaxID=316335 RepID=A0ABN2NBW6_9MICO